MALAEATLPWNSSLSFNCRAVKVNTPIVPWKLLYDQEVQFSWANLQEHVFVIREQPQVQRPPQDFGLSPVGEAVPCTGGRCSFNSRRHPTVQEKSKPNALSVLFHTSSMKARTQRVIRPLPHLIDEGAEEWGLNMESRSDVPTSCLLVYGHILVDEHRTSVRYRTHTIRRVTDAGNFHTRRKFLCVIFHEWDLCGGLTLIAQGLAGVRLILTLTPKPLVTLSPAD